MITKAFIKRRYAESRIGAVTLNPILAASNFIMLIWLTLELSGKIPFWIFVPMFMIGMTTLVILVGFKFRVIQLSTDEDIKYEKQRALNKTLYQIMLALDDGTKSPEFYKRLDYVKKLSEIK